jgi:hypothetical protein
MGPTRPETSVDNYYSTLRNTPEERRSNQHRGRKPKIRVALDLSISKDSVTEHHGRVGDTHASYLEGPGFKSGPRDEFSRVHRTSFQFLQANIWTGPLEGQKKFHPRVFKFPLH